MTKSETPDVYIDERDPTSLSKRREAICRSVLTDLPRKPGETKDEWQKRATCVASALLLDSLSYRERQVLQSTLLKQGLAEGWLVLEDGVLRDRRTGRTCWMGKPQ
jgi:hypothetical protein